MSIDRAIQRLMVLDAIVEDPDLVWLATAEDKAAHFTAITSIAPADLPHTVVGEGDARKVRYFPDRFPIGINLAGRGVLVYAFSEPDMNGFRLFIERHAAVLRALSAWTLRLVMPPDLHSIGDQARNVVEAHLMAPMRPASLDEMRWYEQRRSASPTDLVRFNRDRQAFASPHFQWSTGYGCITARPPW